MPNVRHDADDYWRSWSTEPYWEQFPIMHLFPVPDHASLSRNVCPFAHKPTVQIVASGYTNGGWAVEGRAMANPSLCEDDRES